MENTKQFRFEQDEASFFISENDAVMGPFKPSEILEKLSVKTISWVDFTYRETDGKWVRLCENPDFKAFQSEMPKVTPKKVVPPPPPVQAEKPQVKWFLFQNETQTGPYSESELRRQVQTGQILAQAYVWQEAFTDWKPILETQEFRPVANSHPHLQANLQANLPIEKKPEERRASPRKPLLAQVYLTNQKQLTAAVCRDISVGGMQVLTDEVPGKTGESIRLNVMPPASSGMRPFVASGVIVRILEDQRGFSFRFTEITDEAKRSIERYVS